jgi:hypothetical protein
VLRPFPSWFFGLRVIPHLQEHLLHVGEPKLALVVLPERVQLLSSDRVGLDGALLGSRIRGELTSSKEQPAVT